MVDPPSEETHPSSDEETPGPGIPRHAWERIARTIIQEGLTADGLTIPEDDLRQWIIALGRFYEQEERQD